MTSMQIETLAKLRAALADIQRDRRIAEQETAPCHNIFRLLGVQRYETWLHSPLLRDLLDPYGSHGQGAVFLQGFVELIATQQGWPVPEIPEWPPVAEWVVSLEVDRIDISVRNARANWLVFIENKIGAGFQPDQMQRYAQILEGRRTPMSRHALVLLAPKDLPLASLQGPYKTLWYERDVVPWLEKALPRIKSPAVISTVRQYLEIVRDVGAKTMNQPGDLEALLAQPSYLRLGAEIAGVIERVKQSLLQKFWASVERQMQDGLVSLNLASSWKLVSDPNGQFIPNQRFVTPIDKNAVGGKIALGVFQEDNGSKLRYGLGFIEKFHAPEWPEVMTTLRQELLTLYGEASSKSMEWYIYWRECVENPKSVDFLERVARDAELCASQFTWLALAMLRDKNDRLLDVGRALAARRAL
jgi:hypothetical protein